MEKESVNAFFEPAAMKGGEGPHSYAHNSTAQRLGIEAAKGLIQGGIANKLNPETLSTCTNPICIADLGCSTGPNTFIAVQYIIEAIELQYRSHGLALPEFLVFFNDRISNDFNTLFKLLPSKRNYFAAGVPGSFYGRLFPKESLSFVHSFASLNWISKVPKEITDKSSAAWNKGRIHYTNARKKVVDAYASQYKEDMEIFLHARAQEVVGNGLMALQIPAVDDLIFDQDIYPLKDFELLETCLVDMVNEGKINEEKVDSFNLPIFFSPLKNLQKILESNEDFCIEQMEILGVNTFSTSMNAEFHVSHSRAALEGLITNHFGDEIIDELFGRYTKKLKEFPDLTDLRKLRTISLFVLLRRKLRE